MKFINMLYDIAAKIVNSEKQNEAYYLEKKEEWKDKHGEPVVNTETGKVEKREQDGKI